MKKQLLFKTLFAITIILSISLAACGPAAPEAPPVEDPGVSKTKVAILFPGVVSDKSWCQAGYEGLVAAQAECDLEIAYSEEVAQDEQVEVFRNYAAEGYDVIIGHGGEYYEAAMKVAPEFPDVEFSITNAITAEGNVNTIKMSKRQMGYLAGYLACEMTSSGKVALVYAQDNPSNKEGFEGFVAGASSCGKDVEAQVVATGSWTDVTKAREASLALIDDGVDVLWQILDAADVGVFSAADDSGIFSIGTYYDQSGLAPNAAIGSVMGSPSTMVQMQACGEVLDGVVHYLDVTNGVSLSLTDLVPADVQEKVFDVVEKMKSGEIVVVP